MIYLIQDCYKNDEGEYIDILKIGYSDKPFMKSRNNQYRTHNFGYSFLGEREGDTQFETYLHEKYKSFRLSEDTEWFLYDDSIVNEFFTVDEGEKDIILTKIQYISNIQEYLLRTITKPGDLYNKYKDIIIEELKSKYGSIAKEEMGIICERIKNTFIFGYNTTINYIRENCTLSNECFSDIPELISKTWLDENPWKNYAELYYKTNLAEIGSEEFNRYIEKKIKRTEDQLLNYTSSPTPSSKHVLVETLQFVAKAKRYKEDYLSVDESAGSDLKPVFNELVMMSEKKAFDIQKRDYANRFGIFDWGE